ncbi:hypothetical protein FMV2238Y02_01960 [Streptococcus canis]|uniref:NADP-dependent oxidoreductase domain-containing protein n=1 Tax=Streptococcus canis TaxID=1329 RepID=A0A3P5XM35_STRCB|nr:hypothetical protein FMV2238Y02_01960 [Streptococcus canis]
MGKTIKMTSGYEIPVLGFGTYQAADGEEAYQSILAAIKAGRRYSLRSLNVDLEPFLMFFGQLLVTVCHLQLNSLMLNGLCYFQFLLFL